MEQKAVYKKWMPLWCAIAYAVIYAVYTWPLLLHPATLFPGITNGYGDSPVILGNAYVFQHSLANGQSPFYTTDWFYPTGSPLLLHGHTMLLSAANWLLGGNNSFLVLNILLLLSFVFSGLGMYRLVFNYTRRHFLAFILGFMWAFSPYKMYQLQDHVWYVLTLFIPYYIINFSKAFSFESRKIKLQSVKRLVYCVLLLLLTFLCDYYTLLFLIYFSGLYFVFQFFRLDKKIRLLSLKTLLVYVVACIAATLAIKWLSDNGFSDNTAAVFAGDIAGYFLPVETGYFKTVTHHRIDDIRENYFFTGFAFIALLLFVFILFIKQKKQISYPAQLKIFLLLFAVFFCLSVPQLRVMGWYAGENPFAVFNYIPFLNNVRVSGRYFSMVGLFGLLSFGIIFTYLKFRHKNTLLIVVLVALGIEYFPPGYQFIDSTKTPEVVTVLQTQPDGVLMPISFGLRDGLMETGHVNTMDIYYQTIHHKKLMGGYISRLDKNIIEYYRSDTIARQLLDIQKSPELQLRQPTEKEIVQFYNTFKPAYILISPEWRERAATKHLQGILQHFNYEVLWDRDYVLYKIKGLKLPR